MAASRCSRGGSSDLITIPSPDNLSPNPSPFRSSGEGNQIGTQPLPGPAPFREAKIGVKPGFRFLGLDKTSRAKRNCFGGERCQQAGGGPVFCTRNGTAGGAGSYRSAGCARGHPNGRAFAPR